MPSFRTHEEVAADITCAPDCNKLLRMPAGWCAWQSTREQPAPSQRQEVL